ncbi:MAG: hypothetical protein ACTS7I_00580 [Candidatus Hodgkinia cicadicola]
MAHHSFVNLTRLQTVRRDIILSIVWCRSFYINEGTKLETFNEA